MQTGETEDYELVEGELVPLPSGTLRLARIRGRLETRVGLYLERNPIGEVFAEVDCRLVEGEVRRPDLSIYIGENASGLDPDRIPAPYPPDIAVEILSPSEGAMGLRQKVREYLRAGSSEVWLLDKLNGEIQVCTRDGVRYLRDSQVIETPLMPGFQATVEELLRG